jgi:hypothetical protein
MSYTRYVWMVKTASKRNHNCKKGDLVVLNRLRDPWNTISLGYGICDAGKAIEQTIPMKDLYLIGLL